MGRDPSTGASRRGGEALRFTDAFVGELSAHLDEMVAYGAATTLLVTTAHGRDAGFADHGGPA